MAVLSEALLLWYNAVSMWNLAGEWIVTERRPRMIYIVLKVRRRQASGSGPNLFECLICKLFRAHKCKPDQVVTAHASKLIQGA